LTHYRMFNQQTQVFLNISSPI